MDNPPPIQSFKPVPAPKSINDLPTELLHIIAQYLAVEADVTAIDQTVQRRRNLAPLCLVSKSLQEYTEQVLYEAIYISDTTRLRLFSRTIKFQPRLGRFVRKLFFDLGICWRTSPVRSWDICDQMYRVLKTTTNLKRLSLDLQECTDCFRNSGPEDIAAGGLSDGYDSFYERVEARVRNELRLKPEHRKFLSILEELCFASNGIPYTHCAFFALPSLRRIISMRDTGAWPMILDSDYKIGTQNPHIKELSLRNSAIVPLDLDVIRQSFPKLEKFSVWTNAKEANRQYDPNEVTTARLDQRNLSANLTRRPRYLRVLELGLHYLKAPGKAQINFPRHLGPMGGITSLGGLETLTHLTIGMHHLMCYGGEYTQPKAEPLLPSVLPPALEHLRLFTCLSCWDNMIAVLSRQRWNRTLPSYAGESTLKFVESLATLVDSGTRLPRLRDVRLYSQTAWWRAYGVDYRTVRHCKEEEGQVWNAGGLEERCGISRFENRIPGIHFRAYESHEYGCDQHQPHNNN